MVTTNIDLSDRLINSQIGTMKYFAIDQNEVETIYIAFDDKGKKESMEVTLLQETISGFQ